MKIKIISVLAVIGAISFPLAGIAAPGDVDVAFSGIVNNTVRGTAIQSDGKIILGGDFTVVNGVPRSFLVRLNPDGSLDSGFNPNVNNVVYSVALQPNRKILIGGWFTTVDGKVHNRLARLDADGKVDDEFNPDLDNDLRGIAFQQDGKIIITGKFVSVNGQTRNYIARLYSNGSLDSGFNPDANSWANCALVQPDGKIIVGGWFTSMGGVTRNRIARLNDDGSLDIEFNPDVNERVNCMVLLPNNNIIIAGGFTAVGVETRERIAELNSNGTPNLSFNASASSFVITLAAQTDGKIIIGGAFTSVNGAARNHIARLNADGLLDMTFVPASSLVNSVAVQPDGKIIIGNSGVTRRINDAATQSLTISDAGRIEWLRGGTSPEANGTTFAISTDGGVVWALLGDGGRVADGWELTGLSLPAVGLIRASATTNGGHWGGSIGTIETMSSYNANTTLVTWRQFYFGSTTNTGNAADAFDYDRDGLANLAEYAFGLIPTSGISCQTPSAQRIGNDFVIGFPAPASVSGITYGAEWSTTLMPGSWTPITDTGTPPQHVFSVPIGSNTGMFTRLKVTSP